MFTLLLIVSSKLIKGHFTIAECETKVYSETFKSRFSLFKGLRKGSFWILFKLDKTCKESKIKQIKVI